MRLFLDANETDAILHPLRVVFYEHEFRSAAEEGLSDVEDLDLLPELGRRRFDVIITRDFNQLADPQERAAIRGAGLHWIGHRAPNAVGQLAIALTAAAYLAALPFVFERMRGVSTPHSFRVIGVGTEETQRIKVNALRI